MTRSIAEIIAALASAFIGSEKTRADPPLALPDTTVQGLYSACTRTVGVADLPDSAEGALITLGNGYCYGFLDGVIAMMVGIGETGTGPVYFSACVNPPGALPTSGALEQVFKSWAENHPEARANPELTGVVAALHETWPCPQTPPR